MNFQKGSEREAKKEKEKEKENEIFVDWKQNVLRNPDVYFSTVDNARIVWDFAYVLKRGYVSEDRDTFWCGRTVSSHFSEAITERVRAAFSAYWRTIKVPLHSTCAPDEQNIILGEWTCALAGVYAEAEHPDWARALGREDAETAARLASVAPNNLPPWIEDLIEHQPEAVDTTLGEELSAQLNDAINFRFPGLLAEFSRASQPVQKFCAPRVWAWLSTTDAAFGDEREQTRMHEHLEKAIDYLLRSSFDRSRLVALAQSRLSGGFGEPFAVLWLTLLLCTVPRQAIELLEQHIGMLDPPNRYSLCENLFAMFDDRRSVRPGLDLSNQDFTAPVLFSLVRLAYAEISRLEDIDRTDGKPFRPEMRDRAQDGRNAVLDALLALGGAEAWAIKQGMRSDPLFADFKDRLDQLAREKAASEAEGLPLADRDIPQIDRYGEAPAADRDGMFQIMMDRLTDLQHDIQAHEFSERSILAGIDQEKDMQVWFARRLQERANGAYRIDREALVIKNKETDIRLLSVRSEAQAVIELKLAHKKYSIDDLEKALESQLLGQYMQHDNCRAGCLLLTTNRKRNWKLPGTEPDIDFPTLLMRLQTLAARLEVEMNYQVKLAVVGIDLTD